jgi:hypothetical protein
VKELYGEIRTLLPLETKRSYEIQVEQEVMFLLVQEHAKEEKKERFEKILAFRSVCERKFKICFRIPENVSQKIT